MNKTNDSKYENEKKKKKNLLRTVLNLYVVCEENVYA